MDSCQVEQLIKLNFRLGLMADIVREVENDLLTQISIVLAFYGFQAHENTSHSSLQPMIAINSRFQNILPCYLEHYTCERVQFESCCMVRSKLL